MQNNYTCQINECEYCADFINNIRYLNYVHQTNCTQCEHYEYYDEDDNIHYNLRSVICVSCDYFDLFTMIYIDEFIKMNTCHIFIQNATIIKKWFKNAKRNKILWKIADYYTKKKYHPDGEFVNRWIENLEY